MAPPTNQKRFLYILENRVAQEGGSLLDLLYPPAELLSLIPSNLLPILKIIPENKSIRYSVDDLFTTLGGYCLFRISTLLLEVQSNYSLASGYFLIYLRHFIDDPVISNEKSLPKLLDVLTRDNGKEKVRVIAEKILPIMKELEENRISPEKSTVIRNGSWSNPSKSYSYIQVNDAIKELIQELTRHFPALKDYLDGKAIPLHALPPTYDIRDHFLSDDEIILLADDVISKLPHGDSEDRSWFRLLHPKVFCHLSNKRLARRALKTIFQKIETHHIELDLLCRQRRYLLARLRGVIPAPEIFLDRSFGTLCQKKLGGLPGGATDIAITEADLEELHPDYQRIFDHLSKGVFFLDLDSGSMIVDRRSAMFHAAYSMVEMLDKDHVLLPKLPLDFFDIYSFAGRIAMDMGRKGRLIQYSRKLIEASRKKHRMRGLLIAGSLLFYADLHPQDREYYEVYTAIVDDLSSLWKKRVPSRILDWAAKILNILGRKLLEDLLARDLQKQPIDTNAWTSALRRYAYLEHPIALEMMKSVINAMPKDYPDPKPFGLFTNPRSSIRWSRIHQAISEFSSPYREILLEYMAVSCPEAMRQCIHDIAKSDSPPALRRLMDIASFRPSSLPYVTFRYARRMLRYYATPARTTIIIRQFESIKSDCQSRNPLIFLSACLALDNLWRKYLKSPLEKYRATPIALGRKLVSIIGAKHIPDIQVQSLLISLLNQEFWPVLDLLMPLHSRFLELGAPKDLALVYREVLLAASNRNNAHILEKEIHSADNANYQVIILECMGNAHALRLDSLFEHYYSSPSAEVAISAITGLTTSIGKNAEERLVKITNKDRRGMVRDAAFESLARIQSPHALAHLKKRLESDPDDVRAIGLLAGYASLKTEKMIVDAIRKIIPSDRWMYYAFLLKSGGRIAINGFREFTGRNPGYYLEDNLHSLNPASPSAAVDEWLSASQEAAEEWQIPVMSILARSPDPRCIPALLEFAYKSTNARVKSTAIKHLTEDVDFTQCPASLETILSYSGLLQPNNPYAIPVPYSVSANEEASINWKRDREILAAYLRSFNRKGFNIPAQWREYIPEYILDDTS